MASNTDKERYDLPTNEHGLFIDGEWKEGTSEESITATSPATGEELGEITLGTTKDVDTAVTAAKQTQSTFESLTNFERASIIHEMADVIESDITSLSKWLSADQGKPLTEAKTELELAAEMYRDAAENVKRIEGSTISAKDPDSRIFTIRQPHGVYGVITPWNYPATIPSEYLGPGLGIGNTIVWVPAPTTSVFSIKLVESFEKTSLPDGALNLVTGKGPVVGESLVKHSSVDAIGFTGSSETGDLIAQNAGAKPTLLELGGNGPVIILDDADLEKAAESVASGCFTNAGQICTASERILVHTDIHEEFRELLVDHTKDIVVANPLTEASNMGPLNNQDVVEKMQDHVSDAVSQGATLLCGGSLAEDLPTDMYYQPTVLDDVEPNMLTNREETFGPIAPIITFEDYNEAIEIANGIDLGLSTGIFTNDISTMYYFAEQINSGLININEGSAHWETHTPVGGHSQTNSGIGRIGGKYTIEEMSQVKNITVNIGSQQE